MNDQFWTLEESLATASNPRGGLRVDPLNPQQPLELLSAQTGIAWSALSLRPQPSHSLQVEEAYVRGSDLIIRYRETAGDLFSFQLNWRLVDSGPTAAWGVELWVSIQTSYLDTAPAFELTSVLPDAPWQLLRHHELITNAEPSEGVAALLAVPHASLACAWLIEPGDQLQFQLHSQPAEAAQRGQLFGAFLEKGVIRRARMRFLMIESPLAQHQFAELYGDFINSPLPLTA
jgi:hypothetical protein